MMGISESKKTARSARLLGRPGIAIRGAANVLRFHWRPSTSPERPEEAAKRLFHVFSGKFSGFTNDIVWSYTWTYTDTY